MNFFFMGGSMGSVVGEKVARSIEMALDERRACIVVSATGGARMQEGILSLMQMAKTSVLLAQLRAARLPFVSVLTDPSTAGVLASYASLGDVIVAEPKALVGFAGAARHPPDHRRGSAARLPARRVRAGEGLRGPDHPPQGDAHRARRAAVVLLALHPWLRPRGWFVAARLRPERVASGLTGTAPAPVLATLQRRLEALWGLERRHPKFGLDGTRALLAGLGHPEARFASVHVAGTNGKGSVCAFIERVLRAAGHRTGLYTSPHLVDFRERIRVNGCCASETELLAGLDRIEALPDAAGATFFEVATALAFDRFARAGVDWSVVEVGLGGRLDSTNVLQPAVSAITTIGLDACRTAR
jgi:hypothetical protein